MEQIQEIKHKRNAIYAGSFDPVTYGHEWMIRTAADLFDHLYIFVGTNPAKKCMFTVAERCEMLEEAMSRIIPDPGHFGMATYQVGSFDNEFLAIKANHIGARYILRGIRNESDYEYERVMRYINADLDPVITEVFLIPPRALVEVSSGMVKALVGPKFWEEIVAKYVSEKVLEKLKEQHGRN